MPTLIWREIVDHGAHLVLAAFLSLTISVVLVLLSMQGTHEEMAMAPVFALLGAFAVFGFCFMGIAQMYSDRTNRISSFLLAWPVTRGQILLARFLVGLLGVLLLLVPVTVTALIVQADHMPPLAFYASIIAKIWVTFFLAALASYGLGLNLGWHSRKVVLLFGALTLPLIVLALLLGKGYDLGAIAVLAVLAAASFVSVAVKFHATPL